MTNQDFKKLLTSHLQIVVDKVVQTYRDNSQKCEMCGATSQGKPLKKHNLPCPVYEVIKILDDHDE